MIYLRKLGVGIRRVKTRACQMTKRQIFYYLAYRSANSDLGVVQEAN